MKNIYIECTQTWESKDHCGISRVVRNLLAEGAKDKDSSVTPFIIKNSVGYSVELSELEVQQRVEFSRTSGLYDYITTLYLSLISVVNAMFPFGAVRRFVSRPKAEFGLLYIVNIIILIPARFVLESVKRERKKGFNVDSSTVEAVKNDNTPIVFESGDIIILPDCPWAKGNVGFYKNLKAKGVYIYMYCHDIIAISHPHYFFQHGASQIYRPWLDEMLECFDGVFCVSEYTAKRVEQYIEIKNRARIDTDEKSDIKNFELNIFVSGLGVKFDVLDDDIISENVAAIVRDHESSYYLMVGTIEIRKNHITVLNAFELLWDAGMCCPLVIVGSWGWSVDAVKDRIKASKYYGVNLFVVNDSTDSDLVSLYNGAKSLVFSSHIEGFGLPLIEAAHYNLPVIASDTEINREVAGDSALYFNVDDSFDLVRHIIDIESGLIEQVASNIDGLTWEQSWLKIRNFLTCEGDRAISMVHSSISSIK